ncbi:MAG: YdbL family protein [Deltaproteobacteria bacterium]|nr:YdbL family protein [Deltaproteobacteria bacterium]
MKTKQLQSIVLTLIIASIMIISSNAQAASLKERMRSRMPQITEFKSAGILGENNRGYLELRGPKAGAETLIKAENQDRRAVYNAIAKQQNSNPENVGQRRAAQIAERAPTGTWLQNNQGEWHRK